MATTTTLATTTTYILIWPQWRNMRGAGGQSTPHQRLLTWKFLLTYREKKVRKIGKREQKKKGKLKKEGGKLKMEGGKVTKRGES